MKLSSDVRCGVRIIWCCGCVVVSDDEQMYDEKGRDESDKYQDKGVEDEEGLKKLVDSGDEEEEDEDKKDDELEEDDESRLRDDKAKGGSGKILMILLFLSFTCLTEAMYYFCY